MATIPPARSDIDTGSGTLKASVPAKAGALAINIPMAIVANVKTCFITSPRADGSWVLTSNNRTNLGIYLESNAPNPISDDQCKGSLQWRRSATDSVDSSPDVGDAAAIERQIASRLGVVVAKRNRLDLIGWSEAQIEAHRAAPIFFRSNLTPIGDAGALWTEMEFQPLSVPAIDFSGARHADPAAFEVICPKRAVSPADGAIARRRRFRNAVEAPTHLTAMTRTFDHLAVSIHLISSDNLADFRCKLAA